MAGGRFADNHNRQKCLGLLRTEVSSANDRNPQRRKVTWGNVIDQRLPGQAFPRRLASLHSERERHGAEVGQAIGERDIGNLRKRLQAVDYLPLHDSGLGLVAPQIEAQEKYFFRLEPRPRRLGPNHGPQKQS